MMMKSIVKVLIQIAGKRGLNVAIVTESYSAADKVGWTNAKEVGQIAESYPSMPNPYRFKEVTGWISSNMS